jgi:replicative DNA helicase
VDDIVKRIPPHSLEAEQSVIGSMIMDREAIAIALEHIDQHDFYHPDLKLVFNSIVVLYNRNHPVDLVTLQDALIGEGQLDRIGGVEYLSKLALSVPTSAHVKNYAMIVKEKSIRRRLIKTGQDIVSESYSSSEELEVILNSAEEKIFNISQNRKTEEFSQISELINPTLNMIVSAHENGGSVTGISSGFIDLDTKTAGLQKADLILVAARPSMGKQHLHLM